MYYQLTEALKRRIINEVQRCFEEYYPQHKDIIDFVQTRYAFSERPQKGVVVSIGGTTPRWLSADNFQGTVISHVMLSKVGDYPGHSIEWVKEDPFSFDRQSTEFPSPPGIYYIEMYSKESLKGVLSDSEFQDVLDSEGDKPFYFFVDPLLSKRNEPVAQATESDNLEGSKVFLVEQNITQGSFRLFQNGHQLTTAPRLTLEASKSLEILEDQEEIGLLKGEVSPEIVSSNTESFDVSVGQNDLLKFEINGITVEVNLNSGFRLASGIRDEIRQKLQQTGLDSDSYSVMSVDGKIKIQAQSSLRFFSNTESTANIELGFSSGWVTPSLKGDLFYEHIEEDTELRLEVDGQSHNIPLYEGEIKLEELKRRLEKGSNELLSVSYQMDGDYRIDHQKGEVELLRPFEAGTKLTADYKHPSESKGPFGIEEKRSRNDVIPGTVLAFGNRIQDGDKMAVVVHDERKDVASEYGGRWDMDVELDIITRDPTTRAEVVDGLLTYFFSLRKGSLSEEGIEITDISSGGESEEVYEDADQEMYFLGSISLSIRTDWAIHIPKPLVIERVRPYTRKDDFKNAGKSSSDSENIPSDLNTTENMSLEKAQDVYIVGKTKDFEKIK